MEIENKIIIEQPAITFINRVKRYISIYTLGISLFGLFYVLDNGNKGFLFFIVIVSLIFGLIIIYKIYKAKFYLTKFYSDSYKVEIGFLNYSAEQTIITTIEKIEIKLKNTSSRAGFNCEIEIIVDNKSFVINDDFDWGFSEMKLLFEYIKSHKKEFLTDNEKFIVSRIVEKLKRNPF